MTARAFYGGGANGSQPSLPADRGYLAWTQPPYVLAAGSALPTAGTLVLRRLRRVPAGVVSNITTHVAVAGTTLTAGQCFAALYTAAGALIAQTSDQASAWASTGLKVMPLVGGPFALAAGDYYVGVWFNGSVGPALIRSGSVSSVVTNAGLTAPNLDAASANTGVTTAAPTPFGAQTSFVFEYWFALS